MTEEPQIGGLPRANRERFFWILVVVFLVALPSLIFYTTGQRLSFDNDETTIVTTGGVYIGTDNLEVDVFMDEAQIERPRLFRNAYYIRDIQAGQHRLVVQRPDLHTWVKELPVDPYIVTEASAFNMPVIPHLRPITEYVTATGTQVLLRDETIEEFLEGATTTVPFLLATTTSTSTFELNQEFVFVESLFSTTSTSSQSVFDRLLDGMDRFRFATTTEIEMSATTTGVFIEEGNMRLVDRDEELYAQWVGTIDNIPYYFCISDRSSSTISLRYGKHVADEVERLTVSTTTPIVIDNNRVCRPEIKLNRLQQDVFYYNFFPGSTDLVLLHLEDGIYVTEIDDRAWQNVQQLYPGDGLVVVVENNSIFVQENGRYFEIITEIEPN
tara:strand:- start:2510 stop:3661 length:1152 start_codon:yes stop_codon:yes gene_type:complete